MVGIYFYNAMRSPVLMAHSVKELVESVTVSNTFRGDVTAEFIEEVEEVARTGCPASLKEVLSYYDFFLDPTIEEFQEKNKRCGLRTEDYLNNVALN